MNITQRIDYLKKANEALNKVHAAAENLSMDYATIQVAKADLNQIAALENALANLRMMIQEA